MEPKSPPKETPYDYLYWSASAEIKLLSLRLHQQAFRSERENKASLLEPTLSYFVFLAILILFFSIEKELWDVNNTV